MSWSGVLNPPILARKFSVNYGRVVKNPDNFFKTSRSLLSSFLDII